jgi:hypothetical protein
MKICLFDPSIENNDYSPSSNLGDLIIQEAVNRELISIFNNCDIKRISTQTYLKQEQIREFHDCSLFFVGGTNLLSSRMNEYRQWKISLFNSFRISNAILLGVGWWQYQENPNLYTKTILRCALSNKIFHSVRDNYTKLKLESIGIKNVLNTGCPTMWPLAGIKPDEIPSSKAENVLLMLTDYYQDIDLDKKLIEVLIRQYKTVFAWPQGRNDLEYIRNFNLPVVILEHSLQSLDNFIKSGIQFDYIGTRLHGGIRCLLARKRSLILEIDNRAKEIAIDTGITTSSRNNFDYIKRWIDKPLITKINLDVKLINKWKSQFNAKYESIS